MIEVKNLSKTFTVKQRNGLFSSSKTYKEAVAGLNMVIPKGEIIGLVGINGAGKTTTIKMLTTILEPDKGSVVVDGIPMEKDINNIRKKINMIAGGERNLYWRLTAVENLKYFGALYGVEQRVLDQRIEELLDVVGLLDSKDISVERYSKGMKQRLQIAKGLINDPDYIFLDEPTLGLDIKIAKELREYIYRISKEKNKGILLTTHYLKEVEELCDYLYIIDHGKLVLEGTTEEIILKINDKKQYIFDVEEFLTELLIETKQIFKKDSINYLEEQQQLVLESNHYSLLEAIEVLSNIGVNILAVSQRSPSLEDVLLELQNELEGEIYAKNT